MATLHAMFKLFDGYSTTINKIVTGTNKAEESVRKASRGTDVYNQSLSNTGVAASRANSGLTKLIGTVLSLAAAKFQSTPPRGWRQQYYTITTTILQHISTNKSYPTPSNHGQPSLHTRKSVLIVQIFRCESPRKSMFASGSHQNTLYRFTARGQVRISAVLPH